MLRFSLSQLLMNSLLSFTLLLLQRLKPLNFHHLLFVLLSPHLLPLLRSLNSWVLLQGLPLIINVSLLFHLLLSFPHSHLTLHPRQQLDLHLHHHQTFLRNLNPSLLNLSFSFFKLHLLSLSNWMYTSYLLQFFLYKL